MFYSIYYTAYVYECECVYAGEGAVMSCLGTCSVVGKVCMCVHIGLRVCMSVSVCMLERVLSYLTWTPVLSLQIYDCA